MGEPACLELRLDSRLDEIARLAEEVDGFCEAHDLPAKCAFHFNLCFDEMITNIVVHGLGEAPGHSIHICLQRLPGRLVAEIVDDAPPFDPLGAAVPDLEAGIDERPIGGLGTHFVRTLMDEVTYARREGRNHLRFGKRLNDAADAVE